MRFNFQTYTASFYERLCRLNMVEWQRNKDTWEPFCLETCYMFYFKKLICMQLKHARRYKHTSASLSMKSTKTDLILFCVIAWSISMRSSLISREKKSNWLPSRATESTEEKHFVQTFQHESFPPLRATSPIHLHLFMYCIYIYINVWKNNDDDRKKNL